MFTQTIGFIKELMEYQRQINLLEARIKELETENAALRAAPARALEMYAHGYTPLNGNDKQRWIGED